MGTLASPTRADLSTLNALLSIIDLQAHKPYIGLNGETDMAHALRGLRYQGTA